MRNPKGHLAHPCRTTARLPATGWRRGGGSLACVALGVVGSWLWRCRTIRCVRGESSLSVRIVPLV